MKVLSIGNSFSQDAHRWLHKLALANGVDIRTVNLVIGGCSLETHWTNASQNNSYYDLERNGGTNKGKISINDALQMDEWDIITLQQVSGWSGIFETYEPYLSSLAELIRKVCPNAKLWFHQTWAYETDSTHCHFANYNNDQRQMFDSIASATKEAAKTINVGIIPAGRVIQSLREVVGEFDYKNGGLSLCRDGFHLSLDYGRYAVAATWLATLSGKPIKSEGFEDFDINLLNKINVVVNETVFK